MSKNKNQTHQEGAAPVNISAEQLKDPGFFGELWEQARLVYYLMRDPNVPIFLKTLPFVGLVYFFFPFDFITDLVPVVGQLDDITLMIIGSKIFIEMAPPPVVAHYIRQMRRKVAGVTVVEGTAEDAGVEPKAIEPIIIDQAPDEVVIEQIKTQERKKR